MVVQYQEEVAAGLRNVKHIGLLCAFWVLLYFSLYETRHRHTLACMQIY